MSSRQAQLPVPRWLQGLIALSPLLLSPALLYLLAEGIVDVGAGEKDVFLVLPWLLWSLAFATCGLVLILRRWSLVRWLRRSALLATTVLVLLFLVTFAASHFQAG